MPISAFNNVSAPTPTVGPSNQSRVVAGGPIAIDDLIEVGLEGLGWGKETSNTMQITDYAAFLTAAATAPTFTSGGAGVGTSVAPTNGQAILQGDDGSIFSMVGPGGAPGAGQGAGLQKWTATLTALAAPQVTFLSAATVMTTPEIRMLSNRNIVCVWVDGTTHVIYFAIVDQLMNVVVAATAVETNVSANLSSVSFHQKIGVDSGGFAIAYTIAAGNAVRFASYNNDGTVMAGPLTVQSWGAIGAAPSVRLALLQTGNIAVAMHANSGTAGSLGLWVGVISQTGAAVRAIANAIMTGFGPLVAVPSIAVMSGFFAVAGGYDNTTGWRLGVFTDTGVLQGSPYAAPASDVSSLRKSIAVLNGEFWFSWIDASPGNFHLTRAPVTGVNYSDWVALSGTFAGTDFATAIDRNTLCCIMSHPSSGYFTVALPYPGGRLFPQALSGLIVINIDYIFKAGIAVVGGDFTVISATAAAGAVMETFVVKFSSSAIVGVATNAVSAADIAAGRAEVLLADTINTTRGCNYLAGSSSILFDMTTSTSPGPRGRKGALQNNRISFIA